MNRYPRDEFDDIDESTARRGAYRGAVVDTATSRAGLLAIIISGVLALMVGGLMYVVSPRTAAPDAATSPDTAAPAPAAAEVSPSPEPTPTTDPSSVKVEVYNSSAPSGSAAQAAAVLEEEGYSVVSTANWAGAYAAESMVYFATGASSEANEIADTLGLLTIAQDYQAETGLIYLVLGADFDPASLGGVSSSPSDATSVPASDSISAPASAPASGGLGAGELATNPALPTTTERYSYDPATATFYLDPTGDYIYETATGTYQLG
ncbi:LytR C-terminal domain-containing protein [Rothia sp. 88186D007BW]